MVDLLTKPSTVDILPLCLVVMSNIELTWPLKAAIVIMIHISNNN